MFETLFSYADNETFGDFFNSLSNSEEQTKFLNKFGPSFHKELQIVTRKDKFFFFKDYEKTKKRVIDESKQIKEHFVKCKDLYKEYEEYKDLYEKNLAEIERHNSIIPVRRALGFVFGTILCATSYFLGKLKGYDEANSQVTKKLPIKTSKKVQSNQNITYGKNEQGPNVENIGWQT